jgi:hypothetical protein
MLRNSSGQRPKGLLNNNMYNIARVWSVNRQVGAKECSSSRDAFCDA